MLEKKFYALLYGFKERHTDAVPRSWHVGKCAESASVSFLRYDTERKATLPRSRGCATFANQPHVACLAVTASRKQGPPEEEEDHLQLQTLANGVDLGAGPHLARSAFGSCATLLISHSTPGCQPCQRASLRA